MKLMSDEMAKAQVAGLKKHQKEREREKSRATNNAARAIVSAVEKETGKELSLALCMQIVQIVQEAQSA